MVRIGLRSLRGVTQDHGKRGLFEPRNSIRALEILEPRVAPPEHVIGRAIECNHVRTARRELLCKRREVVSTAVEILELFVSAMDHSPFIVHILAQAARRTLLLTKEE